MAGRISFIVVPLLGGALSIALSACSSSDNNPTTTPDGGGATSTGGAGGGAAGTGGGNKAGSGGGTAGTGGKAGEGGPPLDDYICSEMAPRDPGGTGADGSACCGTSGKCVAKSTLTGDFVKSLGHDKCSSTLVCAPTSTTTPTKCTSMIGTSDPAGLEGRCIPKCFMLGNPQSLTLDAGGGDGGTPCASGELCAPCFNPVDGTSTGACTQGTDKPTTTAPTPYKTCPTANDAGEPAGGGVCVPSSALKNASDPNSPIYNPALDGLKQDNCATGEKCVPVAKAKDPTYCAKHCTTSTTTQGLGANGVYNNGACQPQYVVFDVAGAAGVQISSGGTGCPTGELCAPCQDPLNAVPTQKPSGACY